MKRSLQFLATTVLFQFSCFSLAESTPTRYHIVAISSPKGYTACSPIAVNDNGAVIGNTAPSGSSGGIVMQSFVFTRSNVTVFPKPWFFTLNNKDTILGRDGKTGDPATATFDLQGNPSPLPGCPNMWPKLITDSGIIAGDSTGKQTAVTSSVLPFTYSHGKVQWYPLPDGYMGGEVRAANSHGTVFYGNVWSSDSKTYPMRAVAWADGKVTLLNRPLLRSEYLHLLGDSGVIGADRQGNALCYTIYSTDAGVKTWLYYFVHGDEVTSVDCKIEGDGPELLDPSAISPSGVIVGNTIPDDHTASKAYAESNGKASDLNKMIDQPGWVLMSASAISSDGKIAGTGTYYGQMSGYLLMPE